MNVLISHNLESGKKISFEEYEKIKTDEEYQFVKTKALNFLSYRPRSKKEVETSLLKKGFEKESISLVLEELTRKGYLDDKEFARTYASHLIKNKMLGRVAVLNRFFIHDIEQDSLNQILNDIYDVHPPEDLIRKIAKKKKFKANDSNNKNKKLIDHLKRKGFTWTEISGSLENTF